MKPPPIQVDDPEDGNRVRVGAVLGGVLVLVVVGVLAWLASDAPGRARPPVSAAGGGAVEAGLVGRAGGVRWWSRPWRPRRRRPWPCRPDTSTSAASGS